MYFVQHLYLKFNFLTLKNCAGRFHRILSFYWLLLISVLLISLISNSGAEIVTVDVSGDDFDDWSKYRGTLCHGIDFPAQCRVVLDKAIAEQSKINAGRQRLAAQQRAAAAQIVAAPQVPLSEPVRTVATPQARIEQIAKGPIPGVEGLERQSRVAAGALRDPKGTLSSASQVPPGSVEILKKAEPVLNGYERQLAASAKKNSDPPMYPKFPKHLDSEDRIVQRKLQDRYLGYFFARKFDGEAEKFQREAVNLNDQSAKASALSHGMGSLSRPASPFASRVASSGFNSTAAPPWAVKTNTTIAVTRGNSKAAGEKGNKNLATSLTSANFGDGQNQKDNGLGNVIKDLLAQGRTNNSNSALFNSMEPSGSNKKLSSSELDGNPNVLFSMLGGRLGELLDGNTMVPEENDPGRLNVNATQSARISFLQPTTALAANGAYRVGENEALVGFQHDLSYQNSLGSSTELLNRGLQSERMVPDAVPGDLFAQIHRQMREFEAEALSPSVK